jgi:hypothetical protein
MACYVNTKQELNSGDLSASALYPLMLGLCCCGFSTLRIICHNLTHSLPIVRSFSTMKNTALTIALCSGLLVCSLGVNADQTGYYRWSDNDGKQHFSQKPPLGRPYDFVKIGSGATISSGGGGDDTTADTPYSSNEPDINNNENLPEKIEILPAKDAALCEKARANIQSLNANGARIRITNADGSSRMLNAEEIKQQENRALDVIKLNCNDTTP